MESATHIATKINRIVKVEAFAPLKMRFAKLCLRTFSLIFIYSPFRIRKWPAS